MAGLNKWTTGKTEMTNMTEIRLLRQCPYDKANSYLRPFLAYWMPVPVLPASVQKHGFCYKGHITSGFPHPKWNLPWNGNNFPHEAFQEKSKYNHSTV